MEGIGPLLQPALNATCLSYCDAASILAIGGAGFAASKVDSGFTEWFSESGALVRVSGSKRAVPLATLLQDGGQGD